MNWGLRVDLGPLSAARTHSSAVIKLRRSVRVPEFPTALHCFILHGPASEAYSINEVTVSRWVWLRRGLFILPDSPALFPY